MKNEMFFKALLTKQKKKQCMYLFCQYQFTTLINDCKYKMLYHSLQQLQNNNNIVLTQTQHRKHMNKMKNQLIEEQDQHLDQINQIAGRLKLQGKEISKEIDKQGVYIKQLDEEVDKTTNKLNFVQQKLGKLLKTNDMGQICTILILFVILVVMIFLVIYT